MKPIWVQLPTDWIERGGLIGLAWSDTEKRSGYIAALMVLIALAHRSSIDKPTIRATYDEITAATHLARPTVSRGLTVLAEMGLITRASAGQSTYELVWDEGRRWAKLPARGLYSGEGVKAFTHFTLRSRVELDALKIYLLLVDRKSFDKNLVEISYDGIARYSGVPTSCINAAISLLIKLDLVRISSGVFEESAGLSNTYRIAHLEGVRPRAFLGTETPPLPSDTIPRSTLGLARPRVVVSAEAPPTPSPARTGSA